MRVMRGREGQREECGDIEGGTGGGERIAELLQQAQAATSQGGNIRADGGGGEQRDRREDRDGERIPAEFYQKIEFVTEWLFELFGEMIERGEMTDTMKMAIVKILFKKSDKKRIENYRPISLLTADYKILAKILTERLKKVLTRLIGAEQQGFIPGGDIAGNLLLVKEIIAHCDDEDMEGVMIMMDFMKAYDRVDRETVYETMSAMNIGEGFGNMVRVLYACLLYTSPSPRD